MMDGLTILNNMRENSRERLIKISRKHSRPLKEVMMLYEELKPIILKHTSLINHKHFGKRFYIIIEADISTRNFILLKNFLKKNSYTNNIYLYNYGLTIDIIIPKRKFNAFLKEIKMFDYFSIKYHEILEVLRQEDFNGKNFE
jgi:hypothetical protein